MIYANSLQSSKTGIQYKKQEVFKLPLPHSIKVYTCALSPVLKRIFRIGINKVNENTLNIENIEYNCPTDILLIRRHETSLELQEFLHWL